MGWVFIYLVTRVDLSHGFLFLPCVTVSEDANVHRLLDLTTRYVTKFSRGQLQNES